MCLVLFYYKPLTKDVGCELVYLKCTSDAKNDVDPAASRVLCQTDRSLCPGDQKVSEIIGPSVWRWPLFVVSMWMPILVVFFELCANRVEMRVGHISY